MKKIFVTSCSLFLVCLIGFGVTALIFGREYRSDHYITDSSYFDNADYESSIFRGDYNASDSWTVHNKFPYVNINSAGVKTVIGRSNTEDIKIQLLNPNNKTVHVEAVYLGDELTIEARPTNITFDINNVEFGLINWLEDIFNGNSDVTVMIGFPEAIYSRINIQQGSGSMQVNDLYSEYYSVQIGSGKCEFSRSSEGGFVSSHFDLMLGSGTAIFDGMETDNFSIDIGSGNFNLNRLSGDGLINMGSGKGEISFVEAPGKVGGGVCSKKIDMGSGNLTLYFPADGGVTIDNMDIGSGNVDINAYGAEKTFNRSNCDEVEEVVLGEGGGKLYIDMSSGNLAIRDSSAYTAPEIISEFTITSVPDESCIESGSSIEFAYTSSYSQTAGITEVEENSDTFAVAIDSSSSYSSSLDHELTEASSDETVSSDTETSVEQNSEIAA